MLEHLQVPYRDASATQLGWQLDAPPQPFLARRHVVVAAMHLELRLLGASHQVLVTDDAGHQVLSELVACTPGGDLPAAASRDRDGLRYRFSSEIQRADAAGLRAHAAALRAEGAADPSMLVGAFPGSPDAVTAIRTHRSGWRTWHVYPQTGEIVATTTLLDGLDDGSDGR